MKPTEIMLLLLLPRCTCPWV